MELILPNAAKLWLFTSATLLLLVVPGPAVLYIVARSVEQGRRAGLVSDLGIHAATLVHVLAAALGLSALIASSPLAFTIIKLAGAAYLVWLGIQKFMDRPEARAIDAPLIRRSYYRLFRDGFIVNLLNPKTALFFFAFLPQFVDASRGQVPAQIIILGLLFTLLGFLSDGCYALAASTISRRLKGKRHGGRFDRYATGLLFIGLGVAAALADGRG